MGREGRELEVGERPEIQFEWQEKEISEERGMTARKKGSAPSE